MMLSTEAVHTKIFGFWLCDSIYSLIALISSFTFLNDPRRILFDVSWENQDSTIFNQELEVGVKCR